MVAADPTGFHTKVSLSSKKHKNTQQTTTSHYIKFWLQMLQVLIVMMVFSMQSYVITSPMLHSPLPFYMTPYVFFAWYIRNDRRKQSWQSETSEAVWGQGTGEEGE